MLQIKNGWVAWFVKNPVAANLLMFIILIPGIMMMANLRLESFPALPPSSITVNVSLADSSAAIIEESILLKMEQSLKGLTGIKMLSAVASENNATITIERTSGYDLDQLYRDVKNRIDTISDFPQKATRPVITQASYLEEGIRVQIYGDTEYQSLQHSARIIRDKLLLNSAINTIAYTGKLTPELKIKISQQKLKALNLTLEEIGAKIANSSISNSAGKLLSPDGKMTIAIEQQRHWQQQFSNIIIKENSKGLRINLNDIAEITESYREKDVYSRFNVKNTIGLIVQLRKNSDIGKIAEIVRSEVEVFQATLPSDTFVTVWNDQSLYINGRLSLLVKNSIQGIIIVMILLALFLNLRVALWVGIGLPVIFAGASLMMGPSLYNLTLNELTTFGFIMALGIVVDDAVVVGESIHASRERYGPTITATIWGAEKVTIATVFGVLTTLVAFMSLTFIQGEMGQIFSHFAYAVAFCLMFSLIESKLILPAHLATLKMQASSSPNILSSSWSKAQQAAQYALTYFTRKIYRPLIHALLTYRYHTLLCSISILIAVSGLLISGSVRSVFFPDIPSDIMSVSMLFENNTHPSVILTESLKVERAAIEVSNALQTQYALKTEPIVNLVTDINQGETSFLIELSPRQERPFSANYLIRAWQQKISALESVSKLEFTESFNDGDDINLELGSTDNELLAESASAVAKALATFKGVSGIYNNLKEKEPQLVLSLRPQGRALGFQLNPIIIQVRNAIQGYEIQKIQRNAEEVKVTISYLDEQRQDLYDLKRVQLKDSKGNLHSLENIVQISVKNKAAQHYRVNGSRVAVITADIDKSITSASEILPLLEETLLDSLRQQPNLNVAIRGEAENQKETSQSLKLLFTLTLLAIYALLAIPLKSYFQPIIIMAAIPFGIVGAILGHWLHDVPLSLLSFFGILALCGVVVNDSLLLMTHFNQLRQSKLGVKLCIIKATCHRMRAIILTSTTTFFGLLPLISEQSEQAQFLIPAAIAMGYGILFATVITLIIIPVLILVTHDVNTFVFSRHRKQTINKQTIEFKQ